MVRMQLGRDPDGLLDVGGVLRLRHGALHGYTSYNGGGG
jgi:hypothetical protein